MDRRFTADIVAVTDSEIVDLILRHEGSAYTNHPNDRGGPTRWGITIPVLTHWRRRPCTAEDIQALTREEAALIYQANYVTPFAAMGVTTFRANVIDMSVNAGLVRGIKLLQQTVGAQVDGIIGPNTIELATSRDWNPLFVGIRLAFYERIIEHNASQIIFRNGWRRRALSFFGSTHRLPIRMTDAAVFGFMGKAYADE